MKPPNTIAKVWDVGCTSDDCVTDCDAIVDPVVVVEATEIVTFIHFSGVQFISNCTCAVEDFDPISTIV